MEIFTSTKTKVTYRAYPGYHFTVLGASITMILEVFSFSVKVLNSEYFLPFSCCINPHVFF